MTMVLFTAIALVRERERGNLEMLIATPVSPWELTLGKVLPFVAIGLVQVTVVLGARRAAFDVPVRGSLLELYLVALVFIVASLSLGILLSTLAQDAVPGDADGVLHVPAADPAVRLHVPVRRDAGAGAVARGDPAAHAFPAARARHHAARRRASASCGRRWPRSACSSWSCSPSRWRACASASTDGCLSALAERSCELLRRPPPRAAQQLFDVRGLRGR